MTIQTFTVSQAADRLGVSPATVRRWCAQYSAHLSPGARPDSGHDRMLSSQDVEVFREVARLRGEKLSPVVINQRLSEMVFSAPQPERASEALLPVAMLIDTMRSMQDRMEALEQAHRASEAQRPTWRDVFILVLGALITGLMLGLSIWWFQ